MATVKTNLDYKLDLALSGASVAARCKRRASFFFAGDFPFAFGACGAGDLMLSLTAISLLTSEIKRRRARLVLGWGTAWEDLRVLSAFYFLCACATLSG